MKTYELREAARYRECKGDARRLIMLRREGNTLEGALLG